MSDDIAPDLEAVLNSTMTLQVSEGPSLKSVPSRSLVLSDWAAKYAPPKWLVKGLVPTGIGLLIGAPGSGKSFLALNLALHVLLAREWQEKKVRQTGVMWIAAEASEAANEPVTMYGILS